jgi:ABC-type antimicrobial peptide transport system permease subunit
MENVDESDPAPDLFLIVRSSNISAAAEAVRQALREIAPGSPMLPATTIDGQVRASITTERALASLGSAFAGLALLLTAIGIYGTLSYQVNRRTREIAIRMAVGADAAHVVRMVVRRALLLTGAGLAAGLVAAAFAAPLLRSMLFGVRPVNPLALGSAAALLVVIAAVASYLPARRATQVDPMLALRAE